MTSRTADRSVFDAHVDSLRRQLDLGHDLGDRTPGHLDLVRAREGGLSSVVLVNWVDPKHIATDRARARTGAALSLLGSGADCASKRRARSPGDPGAFARFQGCPDI